MKKTEEIENTKKTVKAYKEFSEEKSKEKAEKIIEVTEEMIGEEIEKEKVEDEKEKVELVKVLEEKEKVEPGLFRGGRRGEKSREEIISGWEPKTQLGRDVKNGKVKSIDEILSKNKKILEPEIVDSLLNLKSDLIAIGQSKGKFGGGKRRAWRQTQRKTQEGNIPSFSTMAVIGDENGHVGTGSGKAKETLPARDKSIRKAKLSVFKVERGCSSFNCSCSEPHTVPFMVNGKSGGVRITLMPAPQGTGLVVANELKKVLKLAGVKDVYSKTFGNKRTSFNLVKACMDALKKTNKELQR
uniref:Small ribosomal subunit protein uS5 n=1 Tax=uncultured archaeon Rifle_16ft_4_minimus_1461 TaxID=1665151 RepID=A0A0H4TKP7_9ARCH|nr:30S ribosomal protein S5P, small subunit ribosomal protein S5 [uncultured archaeon Rifle_16ft_4_minimus_1461]